MEQDFIKGNSNFLVKEAVSNFNQLNKILRSTSESIEVKTLITINLKKLNAMQIKDLLNEYKQTESQ